MKRRFNIHEVVKNIGLTSVIASVLVFILTVGVTCAGGYMLYQYTKESILLQGEVNAVRSAKEFDRYLSIRKNAVMLAGHVVDGMVKEGRSSEEILKYMTEESQSIQRVIDKNCTGIYGWIDGEYLDGAGWVPDEDYVPTERPWYIETMADDSPVTFVRPYLDEQTKIVMTTIAIKLSDKTSVLAMDVSLGRMQEITEEIASQSPGSYGVVLDKTGQVIAHSKESELGKNYMEQEGTPGEVLAEKVLVEKKTQFEMGFNGQRYMVYVEDIEGGWKCISLVNTKQFYSPLQVILGLLVLFTLLEAIIFFLVFYNLSAKNMAISIQNIQIAAVADMYLSIYDIDIPYDSIREIHRDDQHGMAHITGDDLHSAQAALNELYEKGVNEMSQPLMEEFLDLSTLSERLESMDTITEEYLDDRKCWCRARFIAADRDNEGRVTRALWMIESIDEEKKRRDKLKHLSETDRMTGLYNRSAGESKITELIERGGGGMLFMLDVDRFKSVNDTFGHDVGDKVIIGVAKAVGQAFRSSDIVMRLGGDEFVAYAPGVMTEEVGKLIIDRIFHNIINTEIKELGDHRVYASIGATVCPEDEIISFAELYKQADICTYESKKTTGNTFTFYREGLDE